MSLCFPITLISGVRRRIVCRLTGKEQSIAIHSAPCGFPVWWQFLWRNAWLSQRSEILLPIEFESSFENEKSVWVAFWAVHFFPGLDCIFLCTRKQRSAWTQRTWSQDYPIIARRAICLKLVNLNLALSWRHVFWAPWGYHLVTASVCQLLNNRSISVLLISRAVGYGQGLQLSSCAMPAE